MSFADSLPVPVAQALAELPNGLAGSEWPRTVRQRLKAGESEAAVLGDMLARAERAGDSLSLPVDDRHRRLFAALIGFVVRQAADSIPKLRVYNPA